MDWERFGIYVFSAFYGYACLTAPYKGRKWVNRLTVFIILLLLMWLPACDDTRTITETEYVDRDVIVTEPYYTRTVYDENMGEFTAEQQEELRTKGYINMRLFYSPRNAGQIWVQVSNTGFTTTRVNGITTNRAGVWVAVGGSGKIAYSTDDGVTWTLTADSKFGTTLIRDVRISSSKSIACGLSGKMAASFDGGVTWSEIESSFSGSTILGIDTDMANRWVAVGDSGKIAYSTDDGVTWTQAGTPSFGTQLIMDICCGVNKWGSAGDLGKIAFSID